MRYDAIERAFEYAHAWSFVYFLNNADKKYQKAFDKFFKDIYTLKKGIEFEIVNYASQSGTGKRVPAEEIQRVVLEALKVKDDEALEELNADMARHDRDVAGDLIPASASLKPLYDPKSERVRS